VANGIRTRQDPNQRALRITNYGLGQLAGHYRRKKTYTTAGSSCAYLRTRVELSKDLVWQVIRLVGLPVTISSTEFS
jgi:hypothetical protein